MIPIQSMTDDMEQTERKKKFVGNVLYCTNIYKKRFLFQVEVLCNLFILTPKTPVPFYNSCICFHLLSRSIITVESLQDTFWSALIAAFILCLGCVFDCFSAWTCFVYLLFIAASLLLWQRRLGSRGVVVISVMWCCLWWCFACRGERGLRILLVEDKSACVFENV